MIFMKKNIKKIIFIIFACSIIILNVDAKENFKINFSNNNINIQDSTMFSTIITKKFETDNVLCAGRFGEFLKQIMQLVKFAVPIIIIALAVVDFIKAMSAQKTEELKTAANKLLKRLIIGAIIFLLPTIIDYILSITGINSTTCGW